MSMYPWRAGEIITAHKLRSGVQYGLVAITPDTPVSAGPVLAGDYLRGTARITFDVPFAGVPSIQVTARTSVPGGTFLEASYTDVSTTGFTIVIARSTDTTTNVDWLAIGVPTA